MSSVTGISAAPAGAAAGRALGDGDFGGQSSERHSRALRAALPWAGLLAVVLLFLGYLAWLHPERFFGRYHDDTVYFSSAQALAQGRGYILPSLPGPGGAPTRQTKYPILFPWLLSWIWRWKPSFPGNIGAAVWMTAAFACWFLIASFLQVRKMRGFGGWSALAIVGLCAFHPHFLFLSGALLSDVPFMALALTAALVADTAMGPSGSAGLAAIAALLAALSLLTRGFGLAVLAGIIAAALFRRAWRQCAVFCLVAAPFAVLGAFGQRAHPELLVPLGSDPGWRQTWLFYTIYGGFWRLGVPHLNVLAAMIGQNLCELLLAPASFCLFPPLGGESFAGGLLNFSLSAGIFTGIVRQARGTGKTADWRPIHFIFVFYSAMTLLWNYPLMDRFLQLFLPLFYAGLWVEGKHFASLLRQNLRIGRPIAEKVLAGLLAAGLVVIVGLAAEQYIRGYRPQLPAMAARRAALGREKEELYAWIRDHTSSGARFIAYEDVSLFLYTGRQAARPIAFLSDAFYMKDEAVLNRDLDHILDVARNIGARYWVASADDFDLETGLPLIEKRVADLENGLPVLFRSRTGKVRLYDLSCVLEPGRLGCRPPATPVLQGASHGA